MDAWAVLILAELGAAWHLFQLGYQGYAELLTTVIAVALCVAVFFGPLYYRSDTASVAASSLQLAAAAAYWGTRRGR